MSQRQVGEGTAQTTVTVIEGVQSDKPEVRDTGAQQRIETGVVFAAVEPVEEVAKLLLQPFTLRHIPGMQCINLLQGIGNPLLADLSAPEKAGSK